MNVYFDACCLSRMTDDQSQPRIREETEATERLLAGVRLGTVNLISSEALADEARRNPSPDRRRAVETLLSASTTVQIDGAIAQRAHALADVGYGTYDALHLAAAESAQVDVLLSTDDRLIRRAARRVGNPRLPVRNPISWSREHRI